MGRPVNDLTGRVFGNWTVLCQVENRFTERKRSAWFCRCVCGYEQVMLGQNLLRGKNTGCGCVSRCGKRPYETLFRLLVQSASGRTYCTLTYEDFLAFTHDSGCHYCGTPLHWRPYFANANGYKLDRKDNNIGYTKGNCVPCCARCNRAKSDHFTYAEWKQLGDVIRSWKK